MRCTERWMALQFAINPQNNRIRSQVHVESRKQSYQFSSFFLLPIFLLTSWHWRPAARDSNPPWWSHRPRNTFPPKSTATSRWPGIRAWSNAAPIPSSSPRPRGSARSGSAAAARHWRSPRRPHEPSLACARPAAKSDVAVASPPGSAWSTATLSECVHLGGSKFNCYVMYLLHLSSSNR